VNIQNDNKFCISIINASIQNPMNDELIQKVTSYDTLFNKKDEEPLTFWLHCMTLAIFIVNIREKNGDRISKIIGLETTKHMRNHIWHWRKNFLTDDFKYSKLIKPIFSIIKSDYFGPIDKLTLETNSLQFNDAEIDKLINDFKDYYTMSDSYSKHSTNYLEEKYLITY
jgi:hypothetical protein